MSAVVLLLRRHQEGDYSSLQGLAISARVAPVSYAHSGALVTGTTHNGVYQK